jgi:competence protein ComFB
MLWCCQAVNIGQDEEFEMSISHHIRNYYEQLVAEEILRHLKDQPLDAEVRRDSEYMADVACVALNRLPPRYIRHEVDMAFYMSPDELVSTRDSIERTVAEAILFVAEHSRKD